MQTPADAFRQILNIFDRLKIPYLTCGSVASSIHGIPRTTMDVDLVVHLNPNQARDLYAAVKNDFYADLETMQGALATGRSFNLIHLASSYKFDIFPLGPDDYSQTEFARRNLGDTTALRDQPIQCAIATPEDTILSKLRRYRTGGEVPGLIVNTCNGGLGNLAWWTCWSG